jgi:hypothetical protein
LLLLLAALLAGGKTASAAIMVLVGEPFGNFGTMMPVGHTAVYLDRVCADGPLHLRMCQPDEPQGVVISRYHDVGNLDWVASPVMEFLYATDRSENIPAYVTPQIASEMRETYRRRYMRDVVPDGTEKDKTMTEWWESAGVAFNRKLWGYELQTTREQDEQFIATMNARPNVHAYKLRTSNCANFAADMVNLYFPRTVEVEKVADFGLMTPKQVARAVTAYGKWHPEAQLRKVEVSQVPGSLRRSRPARGTAEAGLKTKRYLLTLLIIQPEVIAACGVVYLAHGRWRVGAGAEVIAPDAWLRPGPRIEVARAAGTSKGTTSAIGKGDGGS